MKLPQIDLNGNNSGLDGTAAQSEIVAIGNSSFLMLPRDGMGKGTLDPIVFKSVQLVDFASATNILGTYDIEAAKVGSSGALVPDLSTPQANDFFLFIANDNDFQSSDVKMIDATGNRFQVGDVSVKIDSSSPSSREMILPVIGYGAFPHRCDRAVFSPL